MCTTMTPKCFQFGQQPSQTFREESLTRIVREAPLCFAVLPAGCWRWLDRLVTSSQGWALLPPSVAPPILCSWYFWLGDFLSVLWHWFWVFGIKVCDWWLQTTVNSQASVGVAWFPSRHTWPGIHTVSSSSTKLIILEIITHQHCSPEGTHLKQKGFR